MDACFYFEQVDSLLENYNDDRACYDAVFDEAGDPADVENAETEEKAVSLLQKGIAALKSLLNKIRAIIETVISWVKADGSEINEYKKFCAELKKNPELKNKKVTLRDYRNVIAEYDKTLSKFEADYKAMKDEEVENRPSFVRDVNEAVQRTKEKAGRMATVAGSAFTVEAALEYARQNQRNAAKIQTIINWDFLILEQLEKELGKKEVKKFKKKIRRLNSRCGIIRAIAGGRMEQSKTIRATIADTFGNLKGVMKHAMGNAEAKDLMKTAAKEGLDIKHESKKDARQQAKVYHAYAKASDRALDYDTAVRTGKKPHFWNRDKRNFEGDVAAYQQAKQYHDDKINKALQKEADKAARKKQRATDKEVGKMRNQMKDIERSGKKKVGAMKKQMGKVERSLYNESSEDLLDMIDDLSSFTESE